MVWPNGKKFQIIEGWWNTFYIHYYPIVFPPFHEKSKSMFFGHNNTESVILVRSVAGQIILAEKIVLDFGLILSMNIHILTIFCIRC